MAPTSSAGTRLAHSPEWQALQQSAATVKEAPLRLQTLFTADTQRCASFSCEAACILLDYSRNLLTDTIRTQLLALVRTAGMQEAIAAMFRGDVINNTEQRQVLHVALRSPQRDTAHEQAVHATLDQMEAFVHTVASGHRGFSGKPVTDIVNLGIGGSDLGPAMVYQALTPFHLTQVRCHFVSNVDPAHLEQTLLRLDAGSTLFVIASKTFTTIETMLNAQAARQWVLQSGAKQNDLAKHFVAVSANVEKAAAFGIDRANIFPLWDWVGGRYSLWSAIGLPVALGIGMANFRALLKGAHAMDEHFRTVPFEHNMPVLLALLNLWYLNFLGAESQVLLPYAQNLHLFPAFLQQLDMESLGKSVRSDGSTLDSVSGGIVWGSAGTNGQHSFHQLLHQGTHLIPADFIAVVESPATNREMHTQLLANCFAQGQALMDGKTLEQALAELRAQGLGVSEAAALAPHKVIPGNRPSNTLLLQKLTPETLGSLIALYEHKVYAQSVVLGINAFDQWGVELGKILSNDVYKALTDTQGCTRFDASTNALINRVRSRS